MTAVDLSPAAIDAVAQRVAELLQGEDVSAAAGLVDAAEIARRFGVSRDFVYDHAADLGAVKLGDGPRARLRFDPQVVAERLGAPGKQPAPPKRATRRRSRPRSAKLLPIRGES